MKYLLFILLSLFILSCNKKNSDGWSEFVIESGDHKSSSTLEYTRKKQFTFGVLFDSSAIYKTVDPVNQWDVNKLIGVSDGGLHQKNSARFGWRWLNNKLELIAYTHLNGNFYFEKITDLEIGKVYDCYLFMGDDYTFICNGEVVHMTRWRNDFSNNYYLWPYFGGDETAPHDIKINVRY
jgi:hypothetical protein